jgi:tetratricopeptide (TPR) repeat protein
MNWVRRYCVLVVASMALACCASASVRAQSADVAYLYQHMNELLYAGRFAEALPFAQQLQAASEQMLSPDDPRLASVLYDIVDEYRMLGRTDEGAALLKRALAIREKVFGPNHPEVGQILIMLG